MIDQCSSRCSLRFVGDGVIPDEITAALGLAPVHAHRKGDPVPNRPGRLRPSTVWTFEGAKFGTASLEAQIAEILSTLDPHESELRDLAARAMHAEIYCSVFAENGSQQHVIGSTTLQRLASLPIRLVINIESVGSSSVP